MGRLLPAAGPSQRVFCQGHGESQRHRHRPVLLAIPTTPDSLKQIYETLFVAVSRAGYAPRPQNVSIGLRVNGVDVDLVPGKQQNILFLDHSLYRRKADSWTKTNVQTHIAHILAGGRQLETRVAKLWRNQLGLDFPSFYLELAVTLQAKTWGEVVR